MAAEEGDPVASEAEGIDAVRYITICQPDMHMLSCSTSDSSLRMFFFHSRRKSTKAAGKGVLCRTVELTSRRESVDF